jgi:hypothetical protein
VEEDDMLDLAFGLTETSRLGCQVKLAENVQGMVCRLPNATRNIKVERGTGNTTSAGINNDHGKNSEKGSEDTASDNGVSRPWNA